MDVSDLLRDLGGIARRSALLRVVDRAQLERALAGGLVVRDGRGLYALPGAEEVRLVAARLGGVLCLTSAALQHGWAVKTAPDRPHVLVSRAASFRQAPGHSPTSAWATPQPAVSATG